MANLTRWRSQLSTEKQFLFNDDKNVTLWVKHIIISGISAKLKSHVLLSTLAE